MRLISKALGTRRQNAFTLVEVIVSVLILATISIAYYGALSSGFSVVQSTREDLRATQILMQKIEAMRLCTWSQLTNFNFQEPYDPQSATNQAVGAMYFGSVSTNAATSITNNASYKPNIRLVTVTLSWTNFNGPRPQAHTRQMQTQVARYGLQNYVWGEQ